MELIIIGSGTCVMQTRRGPSGYILKLSNEIFLLDGGSGTLRNCLEAGISYRDIDKIFYTHLHPDHTIDLIPFLFATKYTPGCNRTKPLEIYGPVGFANFYHRLIDLYGSSMIDVEYDIAVRELSESRLSYGDWQLETRLMQHSPNAIGYRFEADGKALVYSGDTDFGEGITQLARHADVLLLECSFPDHEKVPGHLTPSEAGKVAALAEAKKLVLTHFYPSCDEEDLLTPCARHFRGEIVLAEDLMRIQI